MEATTSPETFCTAASSSSQPLTMWPLPEHPSGHMIQMLSRITDDAYDSDAEWMLHMQSRKDLLILLTFSPSLFKFSTTLHYTFSPSLFKFSIN